MDSSEGAFSHADSHFQSVLLSITSLSLHGSRRGWWGGTLRMSLAEARVVVRKDRKRGSKKARDWKERRTDR